MRRTLSHFLSSTPPHQLCRHQLPIGHDNQLLLAPHREDLNLRVALRPSARANLAFHRNLDGWAREGKSLGDELSQSGNHVYYHCKLKRRCNRQKFRIRVLSP